MGAMIASFTFTPVKYHLINNVTLILRAEHLDSFYCLSIVTHEIAHYIANLFEIVTRLYQGIVLVLIAIHKQQSHAVAAHPFTFLLSNVDRSSSA